MLQPIVFAANQPTQIIVDENTTLEDAVNQANSLDAAIIKIKTDKTVTNTIVITSNIAIIGINGQHTISNCKIQVKDGGKLTLGDGTTADLLTISGTIEVTDGEINIQDGIKITSSGATVNLSGPKATGTINGGILNGNTALNMEKGAKLSEISGGEFTGKQDALHITDEETYIDIISGGAFYQTDTTVTLHGHAVFVQNEAQIGEISGGYFEAVRNCALVVIRGAWINEISGGEFVATRRGTVQDGDDPDSWNSVLRIEAEKNAKTGVGTISGGLFTGGARFGILLINYFGSTAGPRIDLICGGTIQGAGVGLQPDVNSYVGEISGGTITGGQGILNAGTIDKISGNAKISGTTSYGIYNYESGKINEICGGTISSRDERGIANAGTINLICGGTIIGGGLYGITNRGVINLICGGTIIGEQNAIYNYVTYTTDKGVLETITGGVFWGKTGSAIILNSNLQLEPNLSANRGLGRYQSGNGRIFNNETLVTYPSGYFMSTQTTPVESISDVAFRYLTLDDKYTIEYELNGGLNDENNPSAYDETDLPLLIVDPTKAGYDFQGW
ncbi:InlB B-repeat-containing protein, partial [Candidatus Bathycorpusculum sp.]|uniref:InlB B-repeat-containing protein n=1 Tax=Candidatus Bathycorpusculum sp. TaxID=2994959 RepID=UPI00282CA41C|nr:InlB B-repeat-containing protein [Candidatus Termitimicrobium sp.]MCL2686118.1 InlB B-repeat-containing protein [Candidatus Termitimicrobium sp.]